MEHETFDVLTKFQSIELFVGQGGASHKRIKANVTCSDPEFLCVWGGGRVVVQGRLLENSLILFDEKGLFGLFGVLVSLFEGVIILFFTESGV